MSWRKKKSSDPADSLNLEFEEDRRRFFRVEPSEDEPVFFRAQAGCWPVLDIGAGGISLKAAPMPAGSLLKGRLLLPGQDEPVEVVLEILAPGDTVRGRFAGIEPAEQERIHIYVLERQKQELVAKRKRPLIESGEDGGEG